MHHWQEAFCPATWSNWALAALAGWAGSIALNTLRATNRQADIANKTLLSIQRPRLIIRKVHIRSGTQIPTQGIPDAHPWKIDFNIANIGGSAAHIKACRFAIDRLETKTPAKFPIAEQIAGPPFSLESGEEKELSIELGQELTDILRIIGSTGLAAGYQRTDRVYFWGYAEYADDLGVARNTSTCRHYDNATERFTAVNDPDCEYND